MTFQTPRSFNSWLRGQLKEKKMSQRQLALQSEPQAGHWLTQESVQTIGWIDAA